MDEPTVEGFVGEGYAGLPGEWMGGWYLALNLVGLDDDEARVIREQAQEVIDRYARSERAALVRSYSGVVAALTRRLEHRGLAPNRVLVLVAPHRTDPVEPRSGR